MMFQRPSACLTLTLALSTLMCGVFASDTKRPSEVVKTPELVSAVRSWYNPFGFFMTPEEKVAESQEIAIKTKKKEIVNQLLAKSTKAHAADFEEILKE